MASLLPGIATIIAMVTVSTAPAVAVIGIPVVAVAVHILVGNNGTNVRRKRSASIKGSTHDVGQG